MKHNFHIGNSNIHIYIYSPSIWGYLGMTSATSACWSHEYFFIRTMSLSKNDRIKV